MCSSIKEFVLVWRPRMAVSFFVSTISSCISTTILMWDSSPYHDASYRHVPPSCKDPTPLHSDVTMSFHYRVHTFARGRTCAMGAPAAALYDTTMRWATSASSPIIKHRHRVPFPVMKRPNHHRFRTSIPLSLNDQKLKVIATMYYNHHHSIMSTKPLNNHPSSVYTNTSLRHH